MTSRLNSKVWSQILVWAAATLIVVLGILRFVHLDADFPPGMTWSGELYTDEGWYSSAAINHHLSGKWLLEGDFNPVVNMPIFHLVQAAVFSAFGMSLQTARCTSVCFATLLFVFLYLFARRFIARTGAALCVLLLASNYVCFAYSRLALLELPMTSLIVLSLHIAVSFRGKNNVLITLLASCTLVLAVLLKNTAFFSMPVLMYTLSLRGQNRSERITYPVLSLFVVCTFVLSYNIVMSHYYQSDYEYFKQINITDRVLLDSTEILKNLLRALIDGMRLDPIIYCFSIVSMGLVAILSSEFRKSKLVRISILWAVSYFVFLSVTFYHPPRYYIPMLIPIILVIGAAIADRQQCVGKPQHYILMVVIIVITVIVNSMMITYYMMNLRYSFKKMCKHVLEMVNEESLMSGNRILLGNFSDTISLETGLQGINTKGTRSLAWRISKYRPGFYISLGEEEEVVNILFERYDVEPLCEFNVFYNYSLKRRVWFFRLYDRANR